MPRQCVLEFQTLILTNSVRPILGTMAGGTFYVRSPVLHRQALQVDLFWLQVNDTTDPQTNVLSTGCAIRCRE
jgi:hypothetical protein